MGRNLSLEEVSEEYPIILLDTSALLRHGYDEHKEGVGEKISNKEEEINSAIFFREYLENGRDFYVTPNILKEYLNVKNQPYKKIIKRDGNVHGDKLALMRKIRETSKERRKLASLLEEGGRIFKIEGNELEMYKRFFDEYYTLMKEKRIGLHDYDLLISGLTSAVKREPTCIISNDFPLLHSWNKILKKREMDSSQLGFFIRENFDGFRRAYV